MSARFDFRLLTWRAAQVGPSGWLRTGPQWVHKEVGRELVVSAARSWDKRSVKVLRVPARAALATQPKSHDKPPRDLADPPAPLGRHYVEPPARRQGG